MRSVAAAVVLPTILALTLGAGSQAPGLELLWTYEADQEITSAGFTNAGNLLVTTASRSFLLGGADGREQWTSTDLRDCRPETGDLKCKYLDRSAWSLLFPGSTFTRLYFDKRAVLFDLTSGRAVFDSSAHPLGKIETHYAVPEAGQMLLHSERGDSAQLVSGVHLDDPAAVWTVQLPIAKDFRWLGGPDARTMLVYGKNGSGQRVVTAIDLEAGAISWTRTDLLSKDVPKSGNPVPDPILDRDGHIVLYVSKDGPIRLGPEGEPLWRATALAGENPQAIVPDGDRLIVMQDKKLFGVDLGTGDVLWRHDPHALLYDFGAHALGVLVWSQKDELQMLDARTGAPRWAQAAAIPKGWSPAWWSLVVPYRSRVQAGVGDESQVVIAGRDELVRINLADGQVTTLALFEFGDGEVPVLAERLDGDVLLLSSQNIARFAPDGTRVFHRYHPAPGVGTLARLTQFALSVPYAESSGGFPVGSGKVNASRVTERYLYMYFEDKDSDDVHQFGLVRIDKATGDEDPVLWINERFPEWVLDGTADRVIYKKGDTTLYAVQYPAR